MNGSVEHVKTLLGFMPEESDYPEIWDLLNQNAMDGDPGEMADLAATLEELLQLEQEPDVERRLRVLLLVTEAARGQTDEARAGLEQLLVLHSQNVMIAGALFFVHRLLDPENPKYDLTTRFCSYPFNRVDVLEQGTHQCCASWLPISIGNMTQMNWESAWNSTPAKAVRESMHDASFRYCNKILCPGLNSGTIPGKEEVANKSAWWRDIIENRVVHISAAPRIVNLAYDRSCNLACPSCRREKFVANSETRIVFDELQNRNIAPMLRTAGIVHITGSGDPFASKNFRNLLKKLNKQEYPELEIQLMTNGMLFTPQEWEKFPGLKGMATVRLSIDAARGPTHELLRKGAKWDVMLENMAFIGRLRASGEILNYELTFVVQQENFREMGEAVDLAHAVGADQIRFGRISNWGTFSEEEFQHKCVFVSTHPDHRAFLDCMADPRLQDPIVIHMAVSDFLPA